MRLLRAATLTVRDPAASAALYAQWLDYSVIEDGPVSEDLAASWGAPAVAGRRMIVMKPASGLPIYLRFVQQDAHPDYTPLRHYGWNAIEICNQDVMAVNARMLQSPFSIIGPPKRIDGVDGIHPMQVQGPDGEIVYLTEIAQDDTRPKGLPAPQSFIDCLFILVMGCSDMNVTAHWFERTLGVAKGAEWIIQYNMLANAYGLPIEQLHTICTGVHQGDTFLELDQYPAQATPRPQRAGELPPGIAFGTLLCPTFEAIPESALWITPPARRQGASYCGARVGTLRGPDGTLVEVVEAA